MIFKIGDKVRVISRCSDCQFSGTCILNNGEWTGTVLQRSEDYENEWEIEGLEYGHYVKCHFKEEQLLLVEVYKKEVKLYGICHFVDKYYGGKNAE